VIYRWHPPAQRSTLPPEQIFGAMRAGLRYVRHAPELRAALIRTAAFIVCASALWALLPLQARHALDLGSFGYGVLLGCIGAGAVTGAAFLSKIRQKVSNDVLVAGATVLFAIATLVLAHVHVPIAAGFVMILGGVAWITVMSSLNTAAQAAAPAWARARTLSTYSLVFMGGMAAGSALWGTIATHFGVICCW
jgi:predicted MFS family arabinose efflux permease